MTKLLAPSLLSADFTDLRGQISLVESAGAGLIHCDVMDGRFVPNITFGSLIVEAARRVTELPLDLHLMIEDPQLHIDDFIKAGANFITVHEEAVIHLDRLISRIKESGVKAGVAINPSTPVDSLSEVLGIVDLVLVMSVNPGFGGQRFIPNSLKKIKKLAEIRRLNGYNFLIEVDGGVNLANAAEIASAGCDILVAGSAVFNTQDIKSTVGKFIEILNKRG